MRIEPLPFFFDLGSQRIGFFNGSFSGFHFFELFIDFENLALGFQGRRDRFASASTSIPATLFRFPRGGLEVKDTDSTPGRPRNRLCRVSK